MPGMWLHVVATAKVVRGWWAVALRTGIAETRWAKARRFHPLRVCSARRSATQNVGMSDKAWDIDRRVVDLSAIA